MGGVVALEFEAGAQVTHHGEYVGHVAVGVFEHQLVAVFQVGLFPLVFELFVALEHGEQAEVHGAHVHGGHFRLEFECRFETLVEGHVGGAAGGQVEHGVATLLDLGQESAEGGGRLVGTTILLVAGVQVDNGGTGLRGTHGGVGDLIGGHRQVGGHGGGVDCAGDGTGDDDFALFGHGWVLRSGVYRGILHQRRELLVYCLRRLYGVCVVALRLCGSWDICAAGAL